MVKRVRKRRGGWRSLSGLRWSEVTDIHEVAYKGRFNAVIDIMPTAGTDAERKRYCARVVGHLGQSLKRRDLEHVGVTTYEKKSGVDLHAHHMCRIPPGHQDLLARYDGCVVKAQIFPPSKRNAKVGYRTKQRLPLSPEFEKNTWHRREKGLPIPGPRVSYTKAAAALLQKPSYVNIVVPPVRPATDLKPSGQIFMFPEIERLPSRLRDFRGGHVTPAQQLEAEFRRQQLGLSQHQLAQLIGLSQPHYANVVRGHDRMSRYAARRLKEALLHDKAA